MEDDIEGAQLYAAPLEDEDESVSERQPEDDESLAETQYALEEERAATDAAASEDTPAPFGDHQAEFEELGLALAWWREERGEAPLSILFNLAEDVEGYFNHVDALVRHGLPKEGVLAGEVSLDIRTSLLVFAALQMLGVLVPSLRGEVRNVIKAVSDSTPQDSSEEEKAAMDAAHEGLAEEQRNESLKTLADMGLQPFAPEEFAAQIEEPVEVDESPKFDAGLN